MKHCNICSIEVISTERYITDICESCIDKRILRIDRRQKYNLYKHVVYGLYQADRLVYIGVTGNPKVRFHDHFSKKDFDVMKLVRSLKKREMADEFEKTAILLFRPKLNILMARTAESVEFPKNSWGRDLAKFDSR